MAVCHLQINGTPLCGHPFSREFPITCSHLNEKEAQKGKDQILAKYPNVKIEIVPGSCPQYEREMDYYREYMDSLEEENDA